MDEHLAATLAAIAASTGVLAHGVIGHRWLTAQLESMATEATPLSTRLFGPADVSAVVLRVTWHVVTVVFLSAAVALFLTAFGALESSELLRYIASVQAAIVAVGLIVGGRHLGRLIRAPIPIVFLISMTGTGVFAWIAANSL